MEQVAIRGSQGSWEADVTYEDGSKEKLACLHAYFWPRGQTYDDPLTPEVRQMRKFEKHVALIKEKGRIIMTTDKIDPTKSRGLGFFTRTGYIGVFAVEDFELDDNGMRLLLTKRIANPK
jgi:hypothetical protein